MVTNTMQVGVERKWAAYTLFALFFAFILAFLDRQLLNILIRPIQSEMGIDDVQFSILQGAAFAVVYSVGTLPMAYLSDRYSPKIVVLASILVWSLMTVAFGLASGFTMLLVTRIGLAIGEAGLTPAAFSIVRNKFAPAQQTFAVSILTVSLYVGGGISMIVGGPTLEVLQRAGDLPLGLTPWRVMFAACGGLGAIGFVFALFIMDVRRTAEQKREANFLEFGRLLLDRAASAGSYLLAMIGGSALVYGVMAWTPAMFIRNFGWDEQQTGLTYGTVFIVGGIIGALSGGRIVGWLLKRGNSNPVGAVLTSGVAILSAGTCAAAVSPNGSIALTSVFVAMVGMGATVAVAAYGFQALFPQIYSARATAVYFLIAGTIGTSVGPIAVPLIGQLFGGTPNTALNLALFSLIVGLATLSMLVLHLRVTGRTSLDSAAPTAAH